MRLSEYVTAYDTELQTSLQLAYEAGEIALTYCRDRTNNNAINVEIKKDLSPVTVVDKQVNDIVVNALRQKFPNTQVVGEESTDLIEKDLSQGHVFFVDPIDGTKDFIDNNGQWSVLIGLAVDSIATVGVVYAAADDEMFFAVKGHGAYVIKNRNGVADPEITPVHVNTYTETASLKYQASRSSFDDLCKQTMDELGIPIGNLVYQGSMGIKVAYIASGRADLYVNAKGLSSYWDACAPQVVLEEAGGAIVDRHNNPVRYTGTDTHLRQLMVMTTNGVLDKVLVAVKKVYGEK
jgi:3'(2'), 5'-bisphosphate nucleotidase